MSMKNSATNVSIRPSGLKEEYSLFKMRLQAPGLPDTAALAVLACG